MHLPTRPRRGGTRHRAARGGTAALLTLGLLVPLGAAPAAADVPTSEPFPAAAGWIANQLEASDDPDALLADAILAFAATGTAGDATAAAADDLEAVAVNADGNAGALAKVVLAASAAGRDAEDLDGFDAEAALRAELVTTGDDAGRFGDSTQLFVQSLAILALETTDAGAPTEAVAFLTSHRCDDGSYNFPGTCPAGDVDVTALAAQALLATDADATDEIAFLRSAQAADGSFAAGGEANANSTALAAQALRAAGYAAEADEAAAFVASLQKGCDAPVEERGAIATYPDADGSLFLATSQGVFADAPPLDELDASTSTAATNYLRCLTGDPCPDDDGITVVVDFGDLDPDRTTQITCVDGPFASDTSGHDVLERAGFDTSYASFDFGDSLCQIDELPTLSEGEPADTCFEEGYWSYWSAEPDGEWTAYEVGGGDSRPAAGTIEGWSWAPGFAAEPPAYATDREAAPYSRGIDRACPGTYDDAFTDVAGTTHERAIRCLADAEITRGVTADRYAPGADVTRGQAASLLVRSYEAATGSALPAGSSDFIDVEGSTHRDNIEALAAAGVINGTSATTFDPDGTLSRGQMATLLDRFVDLLDDDEVNGSAPQTTTRNVFADDDDSVHAGAIDRLAVQGAVSGRADGTFGVGVDVDRGQVATFLARTLDLAVEVGHADPVG
ncbi:MAG: S-layer homology domain-containing protein [Nitriliruptor sp.]